MKFKVLKGFSLGGGVDVQPGDIVELPEKAALRWAQQGRLSPLPVEEKKKEKEKEKGGISYDKSR